MSEQKLFVIGASHKTAPLERLASLSCGQEMSAEILQTLQDTFELANTVFLSTCNRTEIYGTAAHPEQTGAQIIQWLIAYAAQQNPQKAGSQKTSPLEPAHFYTHTNRDTISHLFRVMCGLDSMVRGETEIIGQVQRAFDRSVQAKAVNSYFIQLFQSANRTSKIARNETTIDKGHTSVASAAVHLTKRILGNLSKRTALVIGAGETGTLVTSYLRDENIRIHIANRTLSNATTLCERYGGQAHSLEEIEQILPKVDVVIAATDAKSPLITAKMVRVAQNQRNSSMLLLVDISLPHNIEPEVGNQPNVLLSDMNDLKEIVSQNIARRANQIPLVKEIIEREIEQFIESQLTQQIGPLIKELRQSFEDVRLQELEKYATNFTEADQLVVEKMTKGLVNKLLHWPTLGARELAKEPDALFDRARWFTQLFGLEESKRKKQ